MALLRCDFFAETLGLSTSMTVILPQQTTGQIGMTGSVGEDVPVLYLLHGLTDDNTAWTRYTSIERYAAARGIAVVMPQVHRSFYADEANGQLWVMPAADKVIVSGVNTATKHAKARRANDKAGIIDRDMPIHVSNVALVHKGKPVRVGYEVRNGKKVRVARLSGGKTEVI